MRILAIIISIIFHPLLLTTYLVMLLGYYFPSMLMIAPENFKIILAFVFCFTFLLPAVNMLMFKLFGTISSYTLDSRRERIIPFLAISLIYVVTTFLFYNKLRFSQNFNHLILLVTVLVVVSTALTLLYKVSVHSLAVWGAIGIILPLNKALDNCAEDLEFLNKRGLDEEATKPQDQRSELSLLDRLKFVTENEFQKLSYTEAIDILKNSNPNKKKKFQYIIDSWGVDLQSEHERYLVEKHFKKPVILYNYPKDIKAFYMRQNEDNKTVAAMDVLFPGIGEIIGGSQREERYDRLLTRIKEMNLPEKELWWYLDLRKFGSAPHSGFGLGFERLMLFVTGMTNIRDVIPFPRFPGNAEF